MSDDLLLRKKEGKVGTLVLNRPDKGNSITIELLMEMLKALEEWAKDDEVRALVITGAGDKAFCGGFDVVSIPTASSPPAPDSLEQKVFSSGNPVGALMDAVRDYPYPVIGMLNGFAIGAGFNLAICCDIRIAADHVRMGIPPARLGLVYPHEGIKQVIEAIGAARAREVLFTGRAYAPPDVLAMGLVHKMVPRAELESVTYDLAREIADNSPLSLKGIKRIINMLGDSAALSEAFRKEADQIVGRSFLSEDLKEGRLAFIEKRKPKFKGR